MSQSPERIEAVPPVQAENGGVEPKEPNIEVQEVEQKESGVVQQQLAPVVNNQSQQPIADDPALSSTITITIPATPQQLEDWSKGSADDSLTWVAFFWIRMIKKALYYGWRVVSGGTAQLSA